MDKDAWNRKHGRSTISDIIIRYLGATQKFSRTPLSFPSEDVAEAVASVQHLQTGLRLNTVC